MDTLRGSRLPATPYADAFAAFLQERASAGAPPAWTHDHNDFWFRVSHPAATRPAQGWKLHVSANLHAAPTILQRVLLSLCEVPVCFKFALSPEQLLCLNRGDGSVTQVGKFITVYPQSDEQAVALAVALDRATAGLSGPHIASDRRLRPGSLVHYRYGSFGGECVQSSTGAVVSVLRAPDDSLVPDTRGATFQAPAWARDPFAAAGVAAEAAPRPGLLHQRFFPLATIYQSPFSTVSLAVDVLEQRRCVLKAVRHDLTVGDSDTPASALLQREAERLRELQPLAPALYEIFDDGERLYAALEDISGLTLEQSVARRRDTVQPLPSAQVADWGQRLAGQLGALHARGYAYLDLKPNNVIVTPAGELRLIDFDAAAPLGQAQEFARGTRGYMSPQRVSGRPTVGNAADDIYALGGVLYLMATGAEPSLFTEPLRLLDRPLSVLAPALPRETAAVIAACLAPDPEARPASMGAVQAALARAARAPDRAAAALGEEDLNKDKEGPPRATPAPCQERAAALGRTLLAAARPTPDGEGLAWSSSHPTGAGLQSRDVNSGGAGSLLGLCALAAASQDAALIAAAQRGARWLREAPRPGGEPLSGLYVGEGGVILALLRAAQVCGDEALAADALARGRALAALPFRSPDLFNGTAGRLRVHLWLHQHSGDPAQLAAARRCGDALLLARAAEGGWVIPPGYDGMSGDRYLGYAHGAAGIADALLDLHLATGADSYAAAAREAAGWLAGHALAPAGLPEAAVWPARPGEAAATSFWCHGAAGVGLFLLRAAQAGLFPQGRALAERAALSVARLTRWVGTTRCHGLSGNIEFLLECYQLTGQRAYLAEAQTLGGLLLRWGCERDGLALWPSESPTVFSPDYMVGYAGVAACLARLCHPEQRLRFHGGTAGLVAAAPGQVVLPALP